ncbi:MAG TPA: DUF2145 domain-containing protein [Myxococcota bacterium]|nr:DUF2145 domain-containing protein [Myxococcota bacterium]
MSMAAAPLEPVARSFSSHPRNVPPLTPARLARLEACEAEMATKLERALDANASRLALVARVGSDLSKLRFENDERPRYTHVGIALRESDGWRVHQVLNTAEGREGHLYRQTLLDFFRDDPFEYRVSLLAPSTELQERMAQLLVSGTAARLHSPRYSRVAFPFSTRYQNSNQWVLEVVGAAQAQVSHRRVVQCYLAARGLRPSVLRTVGLVGQSIGALWSANTRFDDHPVRDRMRGRLVFMLESSLREYVTRTDPSTKHLELCIGVPIGAGCPEERVVGSCEE